MAIKIYPYKLSSVSAAMLAEYLSCARLYPNHRSRYSPRDGDLIVNWGNSERPIWWNRLRSTMLLLNPPTAVAITISKLQTLITLREAEDIPIPPFTTDIELAREWVDNGERIVCRRTLRTSGGDGITVVNTPDEMVRAQLYTKYIRKRREFRIHVFMGQIIDVTEKLRRRDSEQENYNRFIRSYRFGWIFARNDIQPPDNAAQAAIMAVGALGLDFGGADIGIKRNGEPIVFEVNSAPGIEGTSIEKYGDAIRSLHDRIRTGMHAARLIPSSSFTSQ